MLDKAHIHQINEMTTKQENEIKYNFKKEASQIISKQKEPYVNYHDLRKA